MKPDKILLKTQKATDKTFEITRLVIEKSENLRTPPPKLDKIGTTIGFCVGMVLCVVGMMQMFIGKPQWAIGSFIAGGVTIISNYIHYRKIKYIESPDDRT